MSSNEPPPYPGPTDQGPYHPDPSGLVYDPYSGQPYPQTQQYDPYSGQPYPAQQYPYAEPYPQQYGAYPPAYGYAPPYDDGPKNQAIGALVTNIVMTLFCCSPLAIAGVVVAAMAMSRAPHQPESARTLLRWGWGLAIANVVLIVVLVVVWIAFLASNPEFS